MIGGDTIASWAGTTSLRLPSGKLCRTGVSGDAGGGDGGCCDDDDDDGSCRFRSFNLIILINFNQNYDEDPLQVFSLYVAIIY